MEAARRRLLAGPTTAQSGRAGLCVAAASPASRPHVILSRPQGAGNVGAVARLSRNFNAGSLRIAAPMYDIYDESTGCFVDEALAYAANSRDMLEAGGEAVVAGSFPDAVSDLDFLVGTTARTRDRTEVVPIREAAPRIAALAREGRNVGLVFGNERTGLTTEEADACSLMVAAPTSMVTGYASLNLSHAVGIVLYETFLALDEGSAGGDGEGEEGLALGAGGDRGWLPTSDPERVMTEGEKAQLARQLLEASHALRVEEATTEAAITRLLSSLSGGVIQTRDTKFLFKLCKGVMRENEGRRGGG